MWTLLLVIWYQGLTVPILDVGAPWIAKSFGLTQVGVAWLQASAGASALITLGLARLVDRAGRRRVMLWCLVAGAVFAAAAASMHSIYALAAFRIASFAAVGAVGNSALTMLAERLPSPSRAAGVGHAGMALALGGATCLVVMPLLARTQYSFRGLFMLAAGGLLLAPLVARLVPESPRWQAAQAAGTTASTSMTGVFSPLYRRRAIAMLLSTLAGGVEGAAVGSWSYYYGVSIVGASAATMSVLSLVATAIGFVGFRLGSRAAERLGRVRTVVAFGMLEEVAALLLYLGPARHAATAVLWLGLGLSLGAIAASGRGTANNTAGIELFPTSLRVTMMGWLALVAAVAGGCAHLLVAVLLGPLGSVAHAVALVSMLGPVSLVVFGFFIEETRGLSLEASSLEGSLRASR